jgi:diguanylate cyclase (GGDEF)-like protein/PAS domain S-box-containing protein
MKILKIFKTIDPWRLTIRRDDPRLKDISEDEIRHLRAEQLSAVLALTRTTLIANIMNLFIVCALFRGRGHDLFLAIWATALGAVLLLSFTRWNGTSADVPVSGISERGARGATRSALLLGVVWVTAIIYLYDDASQSERIILAALTTGLASGGALVLATVWQAALAFNLVIMLPALVNLIRLGGTVYILLAALTASFTFVIARAAFTQADLFIDRHLANSKMRAQSQIIGLLLKDFAEGASDFLWETDSRARLTRVSTRFAQLVGQPPERLEGRDFAELLRELTGGASRDVASFAGLLGYREPFRDQIIAPTIEGSPRQWSMTGKPVFGSRGEFQGFRGVGSDVTDAERIANCDLLTGLPNRATFEREAEKAIARLARSGQPYAVMTLDLDRFKRVNDTLGHAVGDALLRAAAKRISQAVGDDGMVTRFGGDEFVILQEGGTPEKAHALCRRLIFEISRPFEIGDFQVLVGASIGVALAPNDGSSFDGLLRNSDLALYRAKAEGRGLHGFFEAGLDEAMQARRRLEVDLREALRAGQLSLCYQPLIDTRTGAITACEALMRWRHPARGDVSPGEFIPLAEEIGLVDALGEWALGEACREAALWPRDLRVAVNVSPVQFRAGNIAAIIADALQRSGLPPRRLEVEVTESVFTENRAETLRAMRAIHELGVRIALDDFGTGFSSLSYLCGVEFDRVKIDKSFVQEIDNSVNGAAVVRAIAALARALGVAMTAEGVETEEQLTRLAALGCDEAQGYLFSQAVSSKDIGYLLGAPLADGSSFRRVSDDHNRVA